jgi:hypothetical protein
VSYRQDLKPPRGSDYGLTAALYTVAKVAADHGHQYITPDDMAEGAEKYLELCQFARGPLDDEDMK